MNKIVITTITLVFFSLFINAQSSKSTIVIENDDHKYELKIKDGEILKFKVDGKKIAKEDYKLFSEILQRLQDRQPATPTPPSTPRTEDQIISDANTKSEQYRKDLKEDIQNEAPRDVNDELVLALKTILIENGYLSDSETKYRIKLKKEGFTLDGDKMSKKLFEAAVTAYEDITDQEFTTGTKVYIKRKRNSNSTSIIRNTTIDFEIN